MGGFNYSTINYLDRIVESGPNSAVTKFCNTTQDLQVFQHVTETKRVRHDQKPSMLDLIFTDEDNVKDDIKFIELLGKSDHAVLKWNLLLETANIHSKVKRLTTTKEKSVCN